MTTGVMLSWILMGSIAISSITCDECEVGEPPWCDGDNLNRCDPGGSGTELGGGAILSPDKIDSHSCDVTCMEVERDDGSTRGYCVLSDQPCSWTGTKCMGSFVAECPYDIGYPVKEEECFPNRVYCVYSNTFYMALCAYEEHACSPEGAQKCWSEDPYEYLTCGNGVWRGKRTCAPPGSHCVEISDEEIACQK